MNIKSHALYAASSSHRWLECPGSVSLSQNIPQEPDSPASIEGTNAHTLMEFALNGNVKDVVKMFANEDHIYDLEMREHVQKFVAWVRSQKKKHDEILVEEKVYLETVHITEAFGTVDVAIIEPYGKIHIIDFKYGKKQVDHVNNSQMIYYALGLAQRLKFDISDVALTIYQPRSVKKMHPARTDIMTVKELKDWEQIFIRGVEACEEPLPTYNQGSYCFFCPARFICPLKADDKLQKLKNEFTSV